MGRGREAAELEAPGPEPQRRSGGDVGPERGSGHRVPEGVLEAVRRLYTRDEGSLSTAELVAVVLGREPAFDSTCGSRAGASLSELARAHPREWVARFGWSRPAAARLAAAFALGRRVERCRPPERPSVRSAQRVYELAAPELRDRRRETFVALLLDGKHRLQRLVPVSSGTLTTSLVHPREVFGPAVRESAAALVVAHNHPSGDPEPSREDLDVTRRLLDAGRLLGIPLLDHVVLGRGSYRSLRERMDFGG